MTTLVKSLLFIRLWQIRKIPLRSVKCGLLLADLHSNAVDFSKTGIPVQSHSIPRYPKTRPDFLAPGPQALIGEKIKLEAIETIAEADEVDALAEAESYRPSKLWYYKSKRILGKL